MATKPIRKLKKYPNGNPKESIGSTKVPLHLVPPSATHYLAFALADGKVKYEPYNWRDAGITISTYKSACERHWAAFWDGEDIAPDSKVHHIAHAMACCAIMLDALSINMVIDDRPAAGASAKLQSEFVQWVQDRAKARQKAKNAKRRKK